MADHVSQNTCHRRIRVSVGILAKHWITPLAFTPFAAMLTIHRLLCLSDSMLAAPDPGKTPWPLYNFAMVLVFYAGVGGYLAHTFWMSDRGWGWVVLKCVALVIGWTTLIVTFEGRV